MPSEGHTPEQIEREIESEREGLSRTLGDLQNRISLEGVMNEVSDRLRTHGGEFGRNVSTAVRDNPVAIALTGIGIAWLILGNRSGGSQGSFSRVSHGSHRHPGDEVESMGSSGYDMGRAARGTTYPDPASPYDDGPRGSDIGQDPEWAEFDEAALYGASADDDDDYGSDSTTSKASERSREAMRRARTRVQEGTDHLSHEARNRVIEARHRALDARDRALSGFRNASGKFGSSARSTRDRAYEAAGHSRDRMNQAWQDGSHQAVDFFERHPLVVGALALAAGAAIGGAAPASRFENRMMGSYRDDFFEEAERIFREETRKAAAVTRAAADEARNVAQEKREEAGHAAESAGDRVREEASDAGRRVSDAAKSEAERQKLGNPSA